MFLVIISQVQIQNNEKWKKKQMTAAQKKNLKVIHGFFFYFEMLVNTLILIFTVPSNYFAKKVIRVTWLTPSYSNTGQVRHALSDWNNQ